MLALLKSVVNEVAAYLAENARLKDDNDMLKAELKLYKKFNPYKDGKIYKVTNTEDTKVYIGCTYQSLAERWHEHKKDYKHGGSIFYRHMKKLGRGKFKIELIKLAPVISRWHLENIEYNCQIRIPEENRLYRPKRRIPYGLSARQKACHYRRRHRRSKRRQSIPIQDSSEEGYVKNISRIPRRRLKQQSLQSWFSI